MKLFNYIIEINVRARQPWSHFKIHKQREYGWHGNVLYKHLVWGKLSIVYGRPHLIPVTVCNHCLEEIQKVGDDYLDYCEGCHSIEGGSHEITIEEYDKIHS